MFTVPDNEKKFFEGLPDAVRADIRVRLQLLSTMDQLVKSCPVVKSAENLAKQMEDRPNFSAKTLIRDYYTIKNGGCWLDLIAVSRLNDPGRNRKANLSQHEKTILRQLVLRCDSAQLALEAFADDPRCSEETRALIEQYRPKRNYPKSLLRAAHVTEEERALARGSRRFQLLVYKQLRKNTWIDHAGMEHKMVYGDLFEFDDMSVNQPYWYEWPWGGDPLSDKFGVRMGRQMLACVDSATGAWEGLEMIGRIKDAYRAEDIVRFFHRILKSRGIPRLGFRLERGTWRSKTVRGVKYCTDEGEKEVFASIEEVVPLSYVYSPNAKGVIEGSFNLLQAACSLVGVQIGRKRGEYEDATREYLATKKGIIHPKDAGFLHIDDLANRILSAMQRLDAREKHGRLLNGVPADLRRAVLAERPLPALAECHDHLFMPVKREVSVRGGHIRCQVVHYNGHLFSFRIPAEWPPLGTGFRLFVCFDPSDPARGAYVFNNETSNANSENFAPRQFLGMAPYAPDVPQFNAATGYQDTGRRAYSAAARTSFRSTGMQAGTGTSIDMVQDGFGRRVVIDATDRLKAEDVRKPKAQVKRARFSTADLLGVQDETEEDLSRFSEESLV